MDVRLSDHFTYKKLLRFVFPSVIMMVFTSVYSVVDGLFVSNFAGKTSLVAVNLIMPFIMILGALGFMIGSGGSATVVRTLGAGKRAEANQYFSLLVCFTIVGGIILAISGTFGMRYIARMLGARGQIQEYCVLYGRISMVSLPCYMLQNVFQSFLVTAEKPKLGLIFTVGAGVTNMLLDWLLVGVCKWGVVGAAIATVASEYVGGLFPLIYFVRKNTSLLQLTKAVWKPLVIVKSCMNGSSELMTTVSVSIVQMMYNFQLMRYEGENGVAAYGVMLYVYLIFVAIYVGYAIGSAPVVGFHFGGGNWEEIKAVLGKSMVIIGAAGIILTLLAQMLAVPLARMYVGYDAGLMELTVSGFRIYSLSFLLAGFTIYISSFFTALSNGVVSAVISFLRTLVFQLLMVWLLPMVLGVTGIWLAIVAAEGLAIVVTVICLVLNRKKYHYMPV